MQENGSLISVLMVLVVMKLWICADSDRSKADLCGKGRRICSCICSKRPQFHRGAALSHHASPRGACLLCQPQVSQRNLLENPQKVLIPEGAWNIVREVVTE